MRDPSHVLIANFCRTQTRHRERPHRDGAPMMLGRVREGGGSMRGVAKRNKSDSDAPMVTQASIRGRKSNFEGMRKRLLKPAPTAAPGPITLGRSSGAILVSEHLPAEVL